MSSQPFYAGQAITAAALDSLPPQILQLAADVTPDSTTPTVLLTATVAEATYLVEGMLDCLIGATATIPKIGFYGTSAESAMLVAYSMFEESTAGENIYGSRLTAMSANSTMSAAITSGQTVQVRFSGTVTFSGGGTFILEAGLTTEGDGYTVKAGSYMLVQQALT
jgi:hypothetical protein